MTVSDMIYSDFQGTCASELATTLNCSSATGCINIIMNKININSSEPGKGIHNFSDNAKGMITSSSIDVSGLYNAKSPTPSSQPSIAT